MTTLRPELEPLPKRMRGLPLDKRGFPVPWFVPWINGEPEFRIADDEKFYRAIRQRRCWVCGEELGRFVSFVAGPMCGINRTSSEPPSHRECAEWSARNCPFLTLRQVKRREDEEINAEKHPMSGYALTHNPGVCLVWTTTSYKPFKVPSNAPGSGKGVLIKMGEPTDVQFFHRGRPATRAEIDASVALGLPRLVELAQLEAGAPAELAALRAQFDQLLPAP